MAKLVWKRLPPGEVAAFRAHLEEAAAGEGPVFGLVGVKASWWTRLGGGARPFVVLFQGDRVVLTKQAMRGRRARSRREYPLDDLRQVSVRRGPLLESARFAFADGYSVRVGSLPRRQSQPVEAFLQEGTGAFAPARLTPEQLTNTYLACRALGRLPGDRG